MVGDRKHLEGANLLIVDDEPEHLTSLRRLFEREESVVHSATSGELALEAVRKHPIQVILTDLMMPGMGGQGLLRAARAIRPEVDVIVMTAFATIETAVEAMREGAYDFIQKPIKSALVLRVVDRALERQALRAENVMLRQELREIAPDSVKGRPIIGRSPAMMVTMETIQQAAPSSATVLLTGESGTGKELIARALHEQSPRLSRPFVAINCAALPESILESELFGHERGAFTGAHERKSGRVERADGGTLFLDEVGEMSPAVQAKLLRVLQEGEFERVGGTELVSVDFRLVAATNRDLMAAVREGLFREDLYYRLNVIGVHLPPLRDRPEDIPLLAEYFVKRYARKNAKEILAITDPARDALARYRWPGNVRELENVVERAVVLTRKTVIDLDDLPLPLRTTSTDELDGIRREGAKVIIPVGTKLEDAERALIRETLKETRGDKSLAAQLLGIAARTIYRRLEAERADAAEPQPPTSRHLSTDSGGDSGAE
ncbi:MAG: sigma-54-dependent Fis family transcriptional regulator [Deltaproteobacteria bacterium]|nr:sigma-54-dependent Fis family transcriptional regulator [Deltaproteobacteria bacterium]